MARATAPLWLLSLVTLSSTFGVHIFAPALGDAASEFGTSVAATQMTISVYVLGLALGQLIYGPLADGLGRRPVLIFGLSLYVVGGLFAGLATSFGALIAARLLQALGGSAGLPLGRAIARDTSSADEALAKLASLNFVLVIGLGLAPLAGSLLVAAFGWRSILLALAVLGAATLLFIWRLLPETGTPRGRMSSAAPLRDYRTLLRSPAFVGFAFGGGCATTIMYAFFTAAPFIFALQLDRPAHEVGPYLTGLVATNAVGNIVARRLSRSISIDHLLIGGNALSLVSAVVFLLIVLLDRLSITTMFATMFFFVLGAGIASSPALTKSFSVNLRLVASASALYGFSQMAVGGLASALVGIGPSPALAAACVLTVASVMGQAGFWLGLTFERRAALQRP